MFNTREQKQNRWMIPTLLETKTLTIPEFKLDCVMP